MALLASRAQKAQLVVFSELLRNRMQEENPPLIRNRWSFLRGYSDVFVGSEVVNWCSSSLPLNFAEEDSKLEMALQRLNVNDDKEASDPLQSSQLHQNLTHEQAVALFQKLLNAGIIKSATEKRKDEFAADKSFFRFAVDEVRCDNFIKSVVIGFRIYSSAVTPGSALFHPVCSRGKFVSDESLQACEVIDWICKNCNTERAAAAKIADHMLHNSIIRPVHYRVDCFTDNSHFYIFSVDFSKTISVARILQDRSFNQQTAQRKCPSPPPTYESLLKSDGSITKAALLHPEAPFVQRDIKVFPDGCGYGFCVRGDGPCFIKIVDPDSPAGKAGVKEFQYVTTINGRSVLDMTYFAVENLIVDGPRNLEITVLEKKMSDETKENSSSTTRHEASTSSTSSSTSGSDDKNNCSSPSTSSFPMPQSWMFARPQRSFTYPQSLTTQAQMR